jgi:nucleoside-diphosphate-sugar epimerase
MATAVDLSQSTIAVTGATGFLGGYLVENLLARGAHVVAVVRSPQKAEELGKRGAEVRRADLAEPEALEQAFRGVDAVISNAAVVSFGNADEMMRTNIEGTRNVFGAIARAGVKRAVAISSTAAYPSTFFRLDERTPLREGKRLGRLNAYAESKAAAERAAWELCDAAGIALTTFRPCGISAPNDPLLLFYLEKLMRIPVVPFPVLARVGMVHAGDVAEAVSRALERGSVAEGKAYNLQGNTVSLWDIGSAWKRAGGRSAWLRIPIPVPFAMRYDDSRARRELGWEPRNVSKILEEAVLHRRPA